MKRLAFLALCAACASSDGDTTMLSSGEDVAANSVRGAVAPAERGASLEFATRGTSGALQAQDSTDTAPNFDGVPEVSKVSGERLGLPTLEPGAAIGQLAQALTVSQRTALSATSQDFTEPASGIIQIGSGTETIVIANENAASSSSSYRYGCFRDAYATSCIYPATSATLHGADPSIAVDASATAGLYTLYLNSANTGFVLSKSTDPCPSAIGGCGSATWSRWSWSLAGRSFDFPSLIDDRNNGNLWVVGIEIISSVQRLYVGRIRESDKVLTSYAFPTSGNCANVVGDDMGNPHAVMVRDNLYITYRNIDENDIEVIEFDTVNGSYNCLTLNDADSNVPLPALSDCGDGCGNQYRMGDVDTGCLKMGDKGATIDVNDPSLVTPSVVISYSYLGCTDEIQQRLVRGAGSGSWTISAFTGCKTSVQPRVKYARFGLFVDPNVVHTSSMYESTTSPGSGLRPVSWRSTNNGVSWTSTFIGTAQTSFPTVSGTASCYWGDYESLSADMINGTMLYTWADGDGTDWTIQAQGINE